MSKTVRFLFIAVFMFFADSSSAHEEGAPFSGAIIEPIRVHHAHIEDEQKLNFQFSEGFRRGDGTKGFAFANSLELAAAWTDSFRIGSEIFIPFSNRGLDTDTYSLGDIEFWPLKFAFINSPETIFTGILSLELPTGSESKDLGSGEVTIGPNFFIDHAYRNWFFGLNTEFGFGLSGKNNIEMELATIVAYSFIKGTGQGMAPAKPEQTLVPALGLEIISEIGLRGEEAGESLVSVLPMFSLWHPRSGFAFRFGIETPITKNKPEDFTVHFQVGNHWDWKRLFGLKKKNKENSHED